MAAFMREPYYELETEITQIDRDSFLLKTTFVYTYDDVWKARNKYEEFFCKTVVEAEKEENIYDKWIVMVGNEEKMIVKCNYVYCFSLLDEAKSVEKRYLQCAEELKTRYDNNQNWQNLETEVLPFK